MAKENGDGDGRGKRSSSYVSRDESLAEYQEGLEGSCRVVHWDLGIRRWTNAGTVTPDRRLPLGTSFYFPLRPLCDLLP